MIIMRSNYDKPLRCPAWSGPAMKWSKIDFICPGGMLRSMYYQKHPQYWFHRCPECGTVVLPFAWRKLSIPWWIDEYKMWKRFR